MYDKSRFMLKKPLIFCQNCKYIALTVQLKLYKMLQKKWVLQMININLRFTILFTTFVFLDRSHASFTNNIYIDHPKNYARLKFDCVIFCFQKITSFHTPHINFKTLTLPSKLQREKCQVVFWPIFLHFFREKLMQLHTSGFSHQTKIYRALADKFLLYQMKLASKLFLSPFGFCSI